MMMTTITKHTVRQSRFSVHRASRVAPSGMLPLPGGRQTFNDPRVFHHWESSVWSLCFLSFVLLRTCTKQVFPPARSSLVHAAVAVSLLSRRSLQSQPHQLPLFRQSSQKSCISLVRLLCFSFVISNLHLTTKIPHNNNDFTQQ